MKQPKTIRSLFCFAGFSARSKLKGVFGDRHSRIIVLHRRKKQQYAPAVVNVARQGTIVKRFGCEICQWLAGASILSLSAGELNVPIAHQCV